MAVVCVCPSTFLFINGFLGFLTTTAFSMFPLYISQVFSKTMFTVDTLQALRKKFPEYRFVWLMGADNLRQIPKWKGWRQIFRMVPIAIFPRPAYTGRALAGKASRRFKRFRVKSTRGPRLPNMRPPAWIFLRTKPDTTSATRIRAKLARKN